MCFINICYVYKLFIAENTKIRQTYHHIFPESQDIWNEICCSSMHLSPDTPVTTYLNQEKEAYIALMPAVFVKLTWFRGRSSENDVCMWVSLRAGWRRDSDLPRRCSCWCRRLEVGPCGATCWAWPLRTAGFIGGPTCSISATTCRTAKWYAGTRELLSATFCKVNLFIDFFLFWSKMELTTQTLKST